MATVAVFGATGTQGGSVSDSFFKTRNGSEKAKNLQSQGVEVVTGNLDDKGSLPGALEGAVAIFLVTSFYESIWTKGSSGAGEEELKQFQNLARVASGLPDLQHLILSTLPPASKLSGGSLPVPHFDHKHEAAEWIQEELPDLWAKTTEYWPGFYASNLRTAMFFYKPPYSQTRILLAPSTPSALIPIAGEVQTNCGVIVEGILKTGVPTFKKIAIGVTDYRSFDELAAQYEKTTGESATFAQVSDETYLRMFGPMGVELVVQFHWGEKYPDWYVLLPDRVLSMKEIGVEDKLVNFEEAMARQKDLIV